jgi:predicted lipoprotein with Yx(FWY)xxD motif
MLISLTACGADKETDTFPYGITAPTTTMTIPDAPMIVMSVEGFGPVLATPEHQALYYWTEEDDFQVHCTDECAEAWPPLIVKSADDIPDPAVAIPIPGTFGVIERPDGQLQVTHERRPLYTYAHEGPDEVLCDDVDGWFVVRLS